MTVLIAEKLHEVKCSLSIGEGLTAPIDRPIG